MIKITIKNKQGIETHGATFKTQAEADAWISEQRSLESWGKPSGVYSESMLSEEEKAGSIEILPEGDIPFPEKQFQIQDQFTVEQTDISSEFLSRQALQLRLENQSFGAILMANISEINKSKYLSGSLTVQDLAAMDLDPVLQSMERSAWRGNIPTLKSQVEAYSGPYFSQEDKAKILSMINKHLGLE